MFALVKSSWNILHGFCLHRGLEALVLYCIESYGDDCLSFTF